MKSLYLVVLAGLFQASALAAQTQPDGQALYRQHCAKCHAEDGRANTWRGYLYFARKLSNPRWQDKESDAEILKAIQQGPGRMPAFGEKLSEEELGTLVQAVRKLRQP